MRRGAPSEKQHRRIPTICYALTLVGIGLIFNLDKKTDQMYTEMVERRAEQEKN